MKNTTKYLMLNLALSIAFCISLHIFAMEPIEKSNRSGESLGEYPIGEPNTSSEGDIEVSPQAKRILGARIARMRTLYNRLDESSESFSTSRRNDRKQLQKIIQDNIRKAEEMYF